MSGYQGDFTTSGTLYVLFNTFDSNDPSASVIVSDFVVGDIAIYKNGSVVQRTSTNGYTLLDTDGINFDGLTGVHGFSIDLSDNTDAGFYAAGAEYNIVVGPVTVDAATITFEAASFSIERTGGAIALLKGTNSLANIEDKIDIIDTNVDDIETAVITNAAGTDVAADIIAVKAETALIVADTNELQADWVNGGRLDLLLDAIQTDLDNATDGLGALKTLIDTVNTDLSNGTDGLGALKTLIDTVNTDLGNGTDGLGALKTLIDAIPTTMVGTDNAALASVVGALTDAAAADEVTTADTLMQYLKQLINILIGTPGIATFKAEAAPANAVSLSEVIRAIHADVTGLAGSTMVGTDSAALASVCTEGRLAELDAANLPTTTDGIQTDLDNATDGLGALKALVDIVNTDLGNGTDGLGALKTLIDAIPTTMVGTDNAALASVVGALTDAAAADDPTAVDTLMQYVKQLVNLLAGTDGIAVMPAGLDPANGVNLFEMVRAGLGATFAAATDSQEQLQIDVVAVQADTDNIQTRLPTALVGGAMDSDVSVIQAAAAQTIRDEIMPTQNAAFNNLEFLFVSSGDHVTPVTAAGTLAVTRSIDGGAFGAGTGTIAEVANGIYQYDASAADMNGGVITFRFTATTGTPAAPDDAFVTVVTGGGV